MMTNTIDLIGFLTDLDYDILKVYENPVVDEYTWWVVNSWEPANINTESINDFNVVTGFEITDFVELNHVVKDKNIFINRFNDYIDKKKTWSCKFHKDIKWKIYGKIR